MYVKIHISHKDFELCIDITDEFKDHDLVVIGLGFCKSKTLIKHNFSASLQAYVQFYFTQKANDFVLIPNGNLGLCLANIEGEEINVRIEYA